MANPTHRVEPVPQDEDLFLWLERLFFGEDEWPAAVEIWRSKGSTVKFERLVQKTFAPEDKRTTKKKAATKEGEQHQDDVPAATGAIHGKPSKELLVTLSNEFSFRCKQHCDAEGKEQRYYILAFNFARSDDYYDSFSMRLFPKVKQRQPDVYTGVDDDTVGDRAAMFQLLKQAHDHVQSIANMYGGAMNEMLDSALQQAKESRAGEEALRARNSQLFEMLESALSKQVERERDIRWNDEKLRQTSRALDYGFNYLLPMLLPNKNGGAVQPSPESLALKELLTEVKDGGKLTQAQCDRAFGVYDEHKTLVKAGAITPQQLEVIVGVAMCSTPADALDKLLPGGELTLTTEQIAQLQSIFTEEQIAPIMVLLGGRLQRRQEPPQPPANGPGANA